MKIVFLITILLFSLSIKAQTITQDLISNGGGFYKQINGSLQFTIAEPVVETYKDSSSFLTQGFQQGNYNIVGIKENRIENIDCEAYPNPTTVVLKIKIKDSDASNIYNASIIDVAGRLIKQFIIKPNSINEINLAEFENASYFLNINCSSNNYFKSYKIQKIN